MAIAEHSDAPPVDSLPGLLSLCAKYMPLVDLDLIRRAYAVANAAHAGAVRKSGEPFIEHPLAVARILASLAMDAPGIAAALLHDTVEDTSLTLDEVEEAFGSDIAGIVDGVTKFTAVESLEETSAAAYEGTSIQSFDAHALRKARQHSETVRKLFLAMSRDPRVVLLKIADRLHNLRTLDSMSPAQRETKSRETLDIYAPLAGRIGLYLIKSELEDLAFSYLEPDAFARIQERLRDEMMKRKDWARRMCTWMERELAARGLNAAVNWRVKRPYRAYREAEEQGMDVGLLHDLIAFRVLVNTKDQCYRALGVIHHLWHPHSERIRDYIATPKANGYQSFHTAVFALDGRLAQIHIRTHQMHRAAQHGVATYWLERAAQGVAHIEAPDYGLAEAAPVGVEEVFGWVNQLASWHRELELSATDFLETVQGDLLDEQVFIFTPKGELRELPLGSTVLDLAYQIHTEIGDHATGAYVQTNTLQGLLAARDVPVEYVLQSGDVVRVTTAPDAWPKPEWSDFARTHYARARIGRTLRQLRRGSKATGQLTPRDELEEPTAESEPETFGPVLHPSGKPAKVTLGRCCFPCPGDTIVGVAQRGQEVTIHRTCCVTLQGVLARRRATGAAYAEPLQIRWQEIQPITYRAYLVIEGQDHRGLMHEISRCAARMGLNVSGSRALANQARYRAAISLTIDVPPHMRLEYILRRLHGLPGILRVQRDTSKGCVKHRTDNHRGQ
ncbi:MAG TPA: HD domain-containing protein [Ktedonobacterales bacterium]